MSYAVTGFLRAALLALLAATIGSAFLRTQEKPQQDAQKPEPAAAPANEARERGTAILKAAIEATGSAALPKIESAELTTRKQTFTAHGTVDTELEYRLAYPAQMRVDEWILLIWVKGGYYSGPGSGPVTSRQTEEQRTFASTEGYDGAAGWLKTPKGTTDFPLDDAARLRIDLVGALGLCRNAAEGKLEAKFVSEEEVQGRKALGVQLGTSTGNIRLYVDPESHLLVGVRSREVTADGTFDTLHTWSDYRRVIFKSVGKEEAIRVPFTWVRYRDDKKYSEEKVKKLKVNTQPNPKVFARPK